MAASPATIPGPPRTPLPAHLPPVPGLDLAVRYPLPRMHGDFFDAVLLPSRAVFLLTDIAGLRDEAGTLAAHVQDTFRRRARELLSPSDANESDAVTELLHELNAALMRACCGMRAAPSFLGCYNLPLSILTCINAGGPLPLFRDSGGTRTLQKAGVPLGLFSHLSYDPVTEVFEPGASLLAVTKGVLESRRGKEEYGAERLRDLFANAPVQSAAELCDTVLQQAQAFHKHPSSFLSSHQEDDLTAVALVRQ